MALIITATDFSAISENAVNYACKLAIARSASVAVIHSFMVPVMFSDIPMPGTLITDAENEAEEHMKKLVARLKGTYPGLVIEGRIIFGNTVDALEEYAEGGNKPWLVVVGNGGPDEISTWPDSTLMETFRKLAYPVLAVPGAVAYNTVHNICFAFDNKHTGNSAAISQVNDFSKTLGASLHVLNVKTSTDTTSGTDIDADAKSMLAAANPNYHLVQGDDINKGIRDFTDNNSIDWLVMIPRKHSFFEGLFHKSHTKAITHNSHIPILAVHETGA